MRIGLDAKRAFKNSSGLGNYNRSVITSLAKFFPQHQYHLFTPETSPLFLVEQKNIFIQEPKGMLKFFHSYWRSKGILNDLVKNKIELYHGLSNELPIGISNTKTKSIVTIHDLIFLRHPNLYPSIDRKIYERKSKLACKEADHIIAISEQTKSDIHKYFGTEENKITVVHQAIDSVFYNEISEGLLSAKAKYQLPEKYILFVGTIEERKNLLALLKAFLKLDAGASIHLVVVGKEKKYKQQALDFISKNKIETKVHFLKNVLTEELPAIYKQALMLVYPSQFEGFGLPIAEAIASGVPVIANNENVFREAGGRESIYADANNEEALTDSIAEVLSNQSLRKKMIEAGLLHSNKFKAEVHAGSLMNVYESVFSM
ncbi:MAG: glycosyltransferase family 4 protein [Chitinophagales bacterium]|nr:glycosyltransferase family 4 protein [Chitinophagales bacterium]